MPERKRFCDLGGMFCRHAYTLNGEPSCRLVEGTIRGEEECVRVARKREEQRLALWFEENGWQKRILFMRGVSYQKDDNELIIDSRGAIFNGKRLDREDENLFGALTLLLYAEDMDCLMDKGMERESELKFSVGDTVLFEGTYENLVQSIHSIFSINLYHQNK